MTLSLLQRLFILSVSSALVISAPPAMAQKIVLPDLPGGCSYTENSSQPLSSSVSIDPLSPRYSDIGDNPQSVVSIGVRCTGKLSSDVSIGIKETATIAWAGPARNIIPTDAKGVGVRLFTETQSQGAQCVASGEISAGRTAECRIDRDDESERSFRFTLKARLVKTDRNTPVRSDKSLRLADGGTLLLSAQAGTLSTVDILNGGLLTPSLVTPAVCTLETGKNQVVNFGTISRPPARGQEKTLGQVQSTPILVSCLPERDSTSGYGVTITFTPGEAMPGDDAALKTGIDDMIVRFTDSFDGNTWLKFGEKINMSYRPDAHIEGASVFSNVYYWHLRYLPQENHSQTGDFNTVATYTIEVQ